MALANIRRRIQVSWEESHWTSLTVLMRVLANIALAAFGTCVTVGMWVLCTSSRVGMTSSGVGLTKGSWESSYSWYCSPSSIPMPA